MNLNTINEDIKQLLRKHEINSITASKDQDCYIRVNKNGMIMIKGFAINCE